MAKVLGRITWGQLLTNWVIVYVANFLGALTMVALVLPRWHLASGERRLGRGGAPNLAEVHHSFLEAFMLGILCNLMVCLAVWAAYSGRTTTDKSMAVTMPIALFVASGFEHSVANMFMLPLGLLIKDTAGADFWSGAGLVEANFADLTWVGLFRDSLLPVTLGNIVGGGVMIGVLYWTIFHFVEAPAKQPDSAS